jgi:hypothetical protein
MQVKGLLHIAHPLLLQELPLILGYENLSGLGGEGKNP